jgi:hypothetical protein
VISFACRATARLIRQKAESNPTHRRIPSHLPEGNFSGREKFCPSLP